jgi:dipeptidyl aminopeptidase/acylaminoacyl peptidase
MALLLEALVGYPQIQAVAPSPDGQWVAVAVQEPLTDDQQSVFLSRLFLVASDGSRSIRLSYGDHSDHSPSWSPDSTTLLFISNRSGHDQIRAIHPLGGESWVLAECGQASISTPRCSPDGAWVAFRSVGPLDPEQQRHNQARDDAYYWGSQDRSARLYKVPFAIAPRPLPQPSALTDGSFHLIGFDWLANSSGFAITAQASSNDNHWPASWLGQIDGAGQNLIRRGPVGYYSPQPLVSPDGAWIAVVCSIGTPHWALAGRVAIFPTDHGSGGEPTWLALTPDQQPLLIGWNAASTALYLSEANRVTTTIFALPIDGSKPLALPTPALSEVAGTAGDLLVVSGEDCHQPNAVYRVAVGQAPQQIFAPALPADWPNLPLPSYEIIHWQSDSWEIEGILTYPIGYQPGQPVPLIVSIHGGPTGVYQRSYLGRVGNYMPIWALAERGYATLRCNPRGSSGYGQPFRFANLRDWGGGDMRDILAGVDLLIERGIADPERLGVMGWSYGGFLSSWIITQTDRFKAACIGAPVTDPISFIGTADIPGFIPNYFEAEYWEDPAIYQAQSPIAHVGKVVTPALIQHGASDIRVPLSQGLQFYEALRRRGIPTDLIVYPRQGHLLNEPRLIRACREQTIAWFERYLTRS